ncbi:MAG: hypothetical protein RLZZ555_2216 [Pseudomonadota bacterium]
MKVSLAYSPAPRQVLECELDLPVGSRLGDALQASGWLELYPELADRDLIGCGIWGRKAAADTALREQDRVEFWRALRVDPKVARRERFQTQGARNAGLFARRRPGSKQGY